MPRTCGTCNACCVIPEVYEKGISKPPYMPCKHLRQEDKKSFCVVYGSSERPDMCAEFVCAWMYGFGSELDNPKYSKVMASINEIDGILGIYVHELVKDAAKTSGRNIIAEMVNKVTLPVVLTEYGTKMVVSI